MTEPEPVQRQWGIGAAAVGEVGGSALILIRRHRLRERVLSELDANHGEDDGSNWDAVVGRPRHFPFLEDPDVILDRPFVPANPGQLPRGCVGRRTVGLAVVVGLTLWAVLELLVR